MLLFNSESTSTATATTGTSFFPPFTRYSSPVPSRLCPSSVTIHLASLTTRRNINCRATFVYNHHHPGCSFKSLPIPNHPQCNNTEGGGGCAVSESSAIQRFRRKTSTRTASALPSPTHALYTGRRYYYVLYSSQINFKLAQTFCTIRTEECKQAASE